MSCLESEQLHVATKDKYQRLFRFVQAMRVRQKRHLFFVLRSVSDITTDTFLPEYGLFSGEFAAFQILSEHSRKESKKVDEMLPKEPCVRKGELESGLL